MRQLTQADLEAKPWLHGTVLTLHTEGRSFKPWSPRLKDLLLQIPGKSWRDGSSSREYTAKWTSGPNQFQATSAISSGAEKAHGHKSTSFGDYFIFGLF